MHRRNPSFQTSPPPSPSYPPQHPSSPAPPPAPPPPPPPGTPGDRVPAYSNAPGRVGKLNQIVQVPFLSKNGFLRRVEFLCQGCTDNYPVPYQCHSDISTWNKHKTNK